MFIDNRTKFTSVPCTQQAPWSTRAWHKLKEEVAISAPSDLRVPVLAARSVARLPRGICSTAPGSSVVTGSTLAADQMIEPLRQAGA